MNSHDFQNRLRERSRTAGIDVSSELGERLEVYFRLLAAWNEKINLTALPLVDPPPQTFDRLLIEPLMAAQYVPAAATRLMDVGSGGGSPAIPLALSLPHLQLLMVESKTRKSVFLREAVRTLQMRDADVLTVRFEELLHRPDMSEANDLVTVRAVRIDSGELSALQHFLKPGGLLLLFRGPAAVEGTDMFPPPLQWKATHPLLEAERSRLVLLEKVAG